VVTPISAQIELTALIVSNSTVQYN